MSEELVHTDADDIAHAAMRGVIGAMAMTGMRTFTKAVGLLDETPPEAIAKKRRPGTLTRMVPKGQRGAFVVVFHWAIGALGGVAFGMLPDRVRNSPWAGPAHGIAVLIPYQLVVSPALGLSHWKKQSTTEHLALLADHLLYGFVLSQFRRRPVDEP